MQFVAIEGNIGAGKTTLAKKLAEHFEAQLILEEFADNPFLPKFYEDSERYAFPLELSFLADRYHQLKKQLVPTNLFSPMIVSDYLFIKSKLFARLNLKEDEYGLFQRVFDIINLQLPTPQLLIYLQSPVHKLQQNIKQRGRSYEQNIKDEYLEGLNEIYAHFLKTQQQKTLLVDVSQIDFVGVSTHFDIITGVIKGQIDEVPNGFQLVESIGDKSK